MTKAQIQGIRSVKYMYIVYIQCESKKIPPPLKFSDIFPFPNGWEFLVQILHAYCTSYLRWTTNFYAIICNFDEVTCHVKQDHHNVLKMSTMNRNARWVVTLNMA